MTDNGLFVQFLIISPLLLVSLVLHELAHGWVAWKLGDPTAKLHGRLTLNPLKHLDTWGTVMLAVTFLGSGGQFLLRLGQTGAHQPAALQGPAARDDARGRRRTLDQLSARARGCGPDLADVHLEHVAGPDPRTSSSPST